MSAPSTATMQSGWCLRFTGGPMRGRTIGLEPGVNVVGSAGGCDIMLPGPDVQPRHLQFNVGELAVAMQRYGEASVRLNGVAVETERRGVVAGDRMALGRVEFEIDRVYASTTADDDAPDSMFHLPGVARETAVRAAPVPARRRLVQAWPVFVGVFMMSVLLMWWTVGTPNDAASRQNGGDLSALRRELASYPEVELVAAAGDQMQLNGFVESQLRKQALEQLIRPYGHKVVGRVQVVEAVVEQARRFVADPGVAVNYGGKGRLVLSGATENAAVQERIQRLAEDFHPAVLVSDKVQYRPKKQEASGEPNSLWANWQSLLPSRVVSITEDAEGMRHIQLANGHRYYEGALLKSGAELKLVTPNELVIAPQGGTP